MRTTTRHLRIFFSMAVALLCFVVCRNVVAEIVTTAKPVTGMTCAMPEDCNTPCATVCEKDNDMLRATHEMGCWAIPSTSVTLQGAAGRMLSVGKTLQRISRVYNAINVDESRHANEQDGALCHALLTKRFHTGYYIYYRCQMRC